MLNTGTTILIILLASVFLQLINTRAALKHSKNSNNTFNYIKNNKYTKRQLMTNYERYFYDILVELEEELNIKILPQINLSTIIYKETNNKYINELFRNIDFAIFSKDYSDLLLLIEINDSTHNTKERMERDRKVDMIVANADIKLIKFYSNNPNKKEYVKQRVRDEIIGSRISKFNFTHRVGE